MTTIAYQSERCTLYHGDALDALDEIESKSVDLIATDPPYGVKFRSNRGQNFTGIAGDDGALDTSGVIAAYVNKLKPFRHVYCFGPDVLGQIEKLQSPVELVWDKASLGMGDLSLPFAPQHERVSFAVHVPAPSGRRRGDGRLAARLRQGSVLRCMRPNGTGVKRHPTEKPVALMRQIIEASSLVGETALDPFAGSGSTLVAAVASGRRAIGIEIDEQWLPVAIQRLEAAERVADMLEAL